jgi:hypothetical protein
MHLEDVRSYDYVNYVVLALHQLHRALRLLVTRPHGLYVNLAVRRGYSSLGRTGSMSTLPCEDHVWFEDRWMVASLCDE